MITNLKIFKLHLESLSADRANKVKLDLLIQTAKEMVDAYAKSEAFEVAKKAKNEEIKKLLNDLGTHSIVCSGVLIEVIGAYDNHSTNLTDYTTFVEQSVDTLGKQYKEMHDKIKQASTEITDGNEYLKFNKNPKGLPTGTMEGIGTTIKGWLSSFKNWIVGFLPKAQQEVAEIKAKLQLQVGMTESKINEATFKSKYKQMIFDQLSNNPKLDYMDLAKSCGFKPEDKSENFSLYANLIKLLEENIVTRYKDGKKFIYSLANGTTPATVPAVVKVDVKVDVAVVDTVVLQETLAKAADLIMTAESEKYFLELAQIKEKQVIAMLNEFKSKKLAIDDKVLQLIKVSAGQRLNKAKFMDTMSDANIVTASIAEMAQNLFALYTKTFQAAESVRQHKDETGLPEGTLGATFDWITKTVTPGVVAESAVTDFLKNIGRKIKQYISNFNILSKRADMALSHI